MTDTAELLERLRHLDIRLRLDGDRLTVNAPEGALTPSLREELGRRRDEVKSYLAAQSRRAPPPLARVPREVDMPVSHTQQRLWFIKQMDPGSHVYNITSALRLTGRLDVPALRRALASLVARHESLRTRFLSVEGTPRCAVEAHLEPALECVDLGHLPDPERERAALDRVVSFSRHPVDITRAPLLRCLLVREDDAHHCLVFVIDHIIADGLSLGILLEDFAVLYSQHCGDPATELPDLPLQYIDYAQWERVAFAQGVLDEHQAYWKRQLAGLPELVTLPADRPRPAVRTSRGARGVMQLPPELGTQLKALARNKNATLFMVLLSAFQVLLHRHSGETDLPVGSVIANRSRSEVRRVIGFFANNIVLRGNLEGDPTVSELIARNRDLALGAYAHQDMPFDMLVDALVKARDTSRSPLFQVLFVLQNLSLTGFDLPDLRCEQIELPVDTARFDLSVDVFDLAIGLRMYFEYNADLFDAASIEHLMGHYRRLLEGMVADPATRIDALPMLGEGERRALLLDWNRTSATYEREQTVHGLFEAQARMRPQAQALVFEGESLTYRELDLRANRLAHHLRALGVGPGALVGVWLERSAEMVVAVLGVLKAGAAYVPLDPAFPQDRIDFMMADAALAAVVTQDRLAATLGPGAPRAVRVDGHAALLAGAPTHAPEPLAAPTDLAYVIYTSGSTGRPKGVMLEHRAVVNFLRSMHREPGIAAHDRFVCVTTLSFDIAGLEIHGPLTVGGAVVLASRATALDGQALAALLDDARATLLQATPATWRLLLDAGWRGRPGLKMLCGGEALPRDLAERLLALPGELWNMYGPTETTIWSTLWRVTDAGRTIPIGRPIANTQCYVLDAADQPAPIGVGGELCIGGDGLARGYLGRDELTAERFASIELPEIGRTRVYRTGDVVRWLANGALEYVGRRDHQVKLRGFRIELGEIETVLAAHPGVKDNAVQVREDAPGDQRLVAYVVTADGRELDAGAARATLRRRLPEYMVPNLFVTLPALPLTPNGKVDRKALPAPAPVTAAPVDDAALLASMTPLQRELAALWAEVLGIERVGPDANFFELGGHSLLATRVIARIERRWGCRLPIAALFQSPTVRQLAQAVEASGAVPAIPQVPRDQRLPVSFMQERLWLFDQLEPGSTAYHLHAGWQLHGELDLHALQAAFDALVARHEMLRTHLGEDDGTLHQVVVPPAPAVLRLVALDGVDDAGALARLRTEASRPFDLRRGPLWRALLLRQAPHSHWLLVTLHHIAADGWALDLLANELTTLYAARHAGRDAALPALPIQFADYAAWQRARLDGPALAESLAYWKAQLDGAPAVLELPLDRPRPPLQTFEGGACMRHLPAALRDRLAAQGQAQGATLFMTLLAGFNALLARHSGQDDLCVGLAVAGRDRAELQSLMGVFINTVVLRTQIDSDLSFDALLRQVRERFQGAYAHQEVPFDLLAAELGVARDPSHAPLFQVMVNMQNFGGTEPVRFEGMQTRALAPTDLVPTQSSKFDLTVYLHDEPGGLTVAAVYNAALFDAARIEAMLDQYRLLLEAVVAAPQQPAMAAALRTPGAESVLPAPAWTPCLQRGTPVHERIREQAQRRPRHAAVSDAAGTLDYAALERLSNQLAHHLAMHGIGREDVVAIHADRSAGLAWALLGVLKAGAAFMLLDPAHPPARSAQCLRLAQPKAWVHVDAAGALPVAIDAALRDLTPVVCAAWPAAAGEGGGDWRACNIDALALSVDADDLAYVAFTSGSTGEPKAIAGTHGPLGHFFDWHERRWALGPGDRFSVLSGLAHDPLLRDVLGALYVGATACMPDSARLGDPGYLGAWMARQAISVCHLTPAMAELLCSGDNGVALPALRRVFFGGDVLRPATVSALRALAGAATMVNFYGATETPQAMGWYEVPDPLPTAQPLPLGCGIDDVQLLVLNPAGALAAVGELGEIVVRTPYLARGYLHDDDATAERFVAAPDAVDARDRMYRSGDLGRYRPDGLVEFAGRRDGQVKVRGYRVETGEIEAALHAHAAVAQTAVVLRADPPHEPRLVAYVVPASPGAMPGDDALRSQLRERLPDYMLPAQFVALDRLPLTPNGKLDRRRLPAPAPPAVRTPPQGATETAIAAIWGEVLAEPTIGADDNFFALGGHSLLATRVLTRLRARLGVELPLRAVFEAPTVAGLARIVDAARGSDSARSTQREDISI